MTRIQFTVYDNTGKEIGIASCTIPVSVLDAIKYIKDECIRLQNIKCSVVIDECSHMPPILGQSYSGIDFAKSSSWTKPSIYDVNPSIKPLRTPSHYCKTCKSELVLGICCNSECNQTK